MMKLTKSKQIWILKPSKEDLLAGAYYASITLPWTFNRMMKNTGSRGQIERGLNIAKGIVSQEMLRSALKTQGVEVKLQRKSHRDQDLFDFNVEVNGTNLMLDVKSIHYFTDYAISGREPLSAKLITDNANYAGPDWRRFFPMLVPHTQISQPKEAYCFCIGSSIDPRRDIDTNRIDYALTAFPSGEILAFTSAKRLILAREEAGKGFYLQCSYRTDGLFDGSSFPIKVLGEWNGKLTLKEITLKGDKTIKNIGPFSSVSSFQVDRNNYDQLFGQIEFAVCKNDFIKPVLNSSRENINIPTKNSLVLKRQDFCNLILPSDYTLFVIGWIFKNEFLKLCRNYTGWVWPDDKKDRFMNQSWSQFTENDCVTLTRGGFADAIQKKPPLINAGWIKTHGKGGGACCYVFPNIGAHGGVRETNLYVLPQDVYTMDYIGK